MMGLGIDIVDLNRASRFVRAHSTRLNKFLLPQEFRRFKSSRSKTRAFALLFAAKEAVSKALGVTVTHPRAFRDYQIRFNRGGLSVRLSDRLRRRYHCIFILKAFRAPGSLGVLAMVYR